MKLNVVGGLNNRKLSHDHLIALVLPFEPISCQIILENCNDFLDVNTSLIKINLFIYEQINIARINSRFF